MNRKTNQISPDGNSSSSIADHLRVNFSNSTSSFEPLATKSENNSPNNNNKTSKILNPTSPPPPRPNNKYASFLLFAIAQAALIVLYYFYVDYDPVSSGMRNTTEIALEVGVSVSVSTNQLNLGYASFQDIHVMVFVGFGFLMSYIKKYPFAATSFSLLLAVLSIQWGILTVNFFEQVLDYKGVHLNEKIPVNLEWLIRGDFAAAAVLVSFGAVLGKASPIQLGVMTFFELIFYGINEAIRVVELNYVDGGGAMVIHVFGAFFGLAVSKALSHGDPRKRLGTELKRSIPLTDTFGLFGTLFLWMYFPSFNAALAGPDANAQQRAVVNTIVSLCASALVAFGFSHYFRGGKFYSSDIQTATLAGGVAIAAAAPMRCYIWAAMFVGILAGFISVGGLNFLQSKLFHRVGLIDGRGVLNTHGLPGLLGGFASAVFSRIALESDFGSQPEFYSVFPSRSFYDARGQSTAQLAGTFVSLLIALGGGSFTGWVISSQFFQRPYLAFEDAVYFTAPDDDEDLADIRPPRESVAFDPLNTSNVSQVTRFETLEEEPSNEVLNEMVRPPTSAWQDFEEDPHMPRPVRGWSD